MWLFRTTLYITKTDIFMFYRVMDGMNHNNTGRKLYSPNIHHLTQGLLYILTKGSALPHLALMN